MVAGLDAGTAYVAVKPNPTGWSGLKKSLAIAAPLAAVGAVALKIGGEFQEMRNAIVSGTGASGSALKSLERDGRKVGKQVSDDFGTVGKAIAELNTATGATGKPLQDMTKAVLDASRALGEDGVANSKAFGRAMNQWGVPAKDGAKTADMLFTATQKYGIGLGETTKNLKKYGGTLQNAGFDMQESVALFGEMEKGGLDVRRAMPGLNMAFRKWSEEGKNAKDELGKTIEQMKGAETGAEALALATETFGAEGAQQMVAAARSGALELDGLGDSLANSEGAIEKNEKATRTWKESLAILRNKGMAYLQPAATALFDKVNEGAAWLEKNLIPAIKKSVKWLRDNKDVVAALASGVAAAGAALIAYNVYVKVTTAVTKAWAFAQKLLNGSLKANPVGIVVTALAALTAGLVLAYKKSDTFRKVVDKAWSAVKSAVSKAWKGAIKPALTALWKFITKTLVPAVSGFWKRTVRPTFIAIGSFIKKTWNSVVKPTLKALWWYLGNVVIPVIKFLWNKVVKPYFGFIGKLIKTWWNRIVKPVFAAWKAFFQRVLFPVIRFLWTKVVKPVFGWIGDKISKVWKNVIKPVFKALGGFIKDTVAPAFRKGVGAIGRAWDGIKALARKPVNFVIDTVYNRGIRKAFNWIADKIDAPFSLPEVSKVGGGSGGSALAQTSGGVSGAFGGAGSHLPHAVSSRSAGPNLADMEAMKATGGPFGFIKNLAGKAWKWLRSKFNDAVGSKLSGLADSPFAQMMGKMVRNLGSSLIAKIKGLFIKSDQSKASQQAAEAKNVKGTKGSVLPAGAYSIGMPYLGYPGHYGADYPASTGTPVRSMAPGIVSKAASLTTSYGKHAYVDHPGGIQTRYAHLNSLNVGTGSKVGKGGLLGTVGSTGNSTGPHLHFEYRRGGSPVNPASLGIFDRGGNLDPGMLAYHSRSIRKPDKVLTDAQFADMHKLAQSAQTGGRPIELTQNFPASATPESAYAASGGRMAQTLAAKGI